MRTDSLRKSSRLQCRNAPSTATLLPTMAYIMERAPLASSCNIQHTSGIRSLINTTIEK